MKDSNLRPRGYEPRELPLLQSASDGVWPRPIHVVDPAEFASAPYGLKVRCAAVTPRVRGKVVAARGVAPPLRTLKEWLPKLLEDAARKETAARLAVPLNALRAHRVRLHAGTTPPRGAFTDAVAGDRDFTKRTTSCPLGPQGVDRIGTPQDLAGFADLPGLSLEAASRKWEKARALGPVPGSGWIQKSHFQGGSG